jgi:hypothetical protein
MTSKYLIPVLVTMMLVTGVCNTLLTKYQVRRHLAIPISSLLTNLLPGQRLCPGLRFPQPQGPQTIRTTSRANRPNVRRRNGFLALRRRLRYL